MVPGHDGGCSSRHTLGTDDHTHRLSASHDTPVGGRAPERVDCETRSASTGAENVPGAIWILRAGARRDRGLKGIGPMYPSCATGWPSYARRATLERSLQQQAQSAKRASSAAASDPWQAGTAGSAVRLAGCAVAFGSCCSVGLRAAVTHPSTPPPNRPHPGTSARPLLRTKKRN